MHAPADSLLGRVRAEVLETFKRPKSVAEAFGRIQATKGN